MRVLPRFVFLLSVLAFLLAPPVTGQKVLHMFNGDGTQDHFAEGGNQTVSGAGDVDNDGFDDLIVSAYRAGDAGEVYVYSGQSGALLATLAGTLGVDELFGQNVGTAGDLNGDGFDDVLVASNDASHVLSGIVYAYSGADGSVLHTFPGPIGDSNFGRVATGIGDVNDDGFDDIGVGAPGDDTNGIDAGAAFIYSGVNGSLLYTLTGPGPGAGLGQSISGIGDFYLADGSDDFVIGAPGDGFGSAWFFSGADGGNFTTLPGDVNTGSSFGYSVSGGHDADGDGLPDFAVGSLDGARLYTGSGLGVFQFGDGFGVPSLALLRDMDGDDRADLALSSHEGFTDADVTSIRVFSGTTGERIHVLYGDQFGSLPWVAAAGDVDGNGYSDLIVGNHFGQSFESHGIDPRNGLAVVYGGGQALKLIEHAPGVEDEPYTVTVLGATPGEKIAFVYFYHPDWAPVGFTFVPCDAGGGLAVASAGYGHQVFARVRRADASGTLTVTKPLTIPFGFDPPGHFRIHAIDIATCRISNLLVVPLF